MPTAWFVREPPGVPSSSPQSSWPRSPRDGCAGTPFRPANACRTWPPRPAAPPRPRPPARRALFSPERWQRVVHARGYCLPRRSAGAAIAKPPRLALARALRCWPMGRPAPTRLIARAGSIASTPRLAGLQRKCGLHLHSSPASGRCLRVGRTRLRYRLCLRGRVLYRASARLRPAVQIQ
jgi:hypothetical protein